jgi:hypothetical protein
MCKESHIECVVLEAWREGRKEEITQEFCHVRLYDYWKLRGDLFVC